MRTSSCLQLCAALALMAAQAQAFTKPAFYKDLEGPKFTVVKQVAPNIELRRYEPSAWASTTREGMDVDAGMNGSFMKLFGYISGGNSAKAKIEMTVPVLTRISPGAGPACTSNFSMAFYQPSAYQAAPASAPAPSDPAVKLTSLPAMDVYVLSFGGFASAVDWRNSAAGLMKKLDELKLPYDAKTWFTAGYDSPYTVNNRRNEVWVLAAPAATTSAAAAKATTTATTTAAAAASAAKPVAAAAGRRLL